MPLLDWIFPCLRPPVPIPDKPIEQSILDHVTSTEVNESDPNHVGGGKEITYIGGIALLVNSITGPGIVQIPRIYQLSGWLTPTLVMLLCQISSSFSASMLCYAMEKVKGNERFKGRVEFSGVAKEFLPYWAFVATMILLVVSLMALLISSVILSAQTMDGALLSAFNVSYGIEFYPHPGFVTISSGNNTDSYSPFGNIVVLSLGYVIVLCLTIPMGLFNLDDNIIIQNIAFGITILIFLEWFINFFIIGLKPSRAPAFVPNWGSQAQVLGTVIFNYAFVTTIPSWANEKRPEVSINKSIWISTTIATVFYTLIGILGAWAFQFQYDQDLLDVINGETGNPKFIVTTSKIAVIVFPLVSFLSSIPVFSIVIKYNLIEHNICRKSFANFWAVLFPWLISILFYGGSGIQDVINWTSLCVNGFINFVVPMILYLIANYRANNTRINDFKLEDPSNAEDDNYDEPLVPYEDEDYFNVLPSKKLTASSIAWVLSVLMTILCVAVIVLNIVVSFVNL